MTTAKEIDRLVAQLGDYRNRSEARRHLQALGLAAADGLLKVVQDTASQENVRWAAITLLGACKCQAAGPVLLKIMRGELTLRGECVRALQSITGNDVGEDPDTWEQVLAPSSTEEPEKAAAAAEENTDEAKHLALFREALGDVATEFSWEDPGYLYMRIPLKEGRKQQMIATFDENDESGRPLTTIYTECGPATQEAIEMIPRRNMTLQHGQFVVEEEDGRGKIVMRECIPTADLYPELVHNMVIRMAREADTLEFEITHCDHI